MEHTFSKVVAFLLTAVLFFVVPVKLQMERQEGLVQLSVMDMTVEFVDEIRNTGILTVDMYEQYQKKVRSMKAGIDIIMVHKAQSLHVEEEEIKRVKKVRTESEILDALYTTGVYNFQKGDYLHIEIQEVVRHDKAMYVFYGGSIRFENR